MKKVTSLDEISFEIRGTSDMYGAPNFDVVFEKNASSSVQEEFYELARGAIRKASHAHMYLEGVVRHATELLSSKLKALIEEEDLYDDGEELCFAGESSEPEIFTSFGDNQLIAVDTETDLKIEHDGSIAFADTDFASLEVKVLGQQIHAELERWMQEFNKHTHPNHISDSSILNHLLVQPMIAANKAVSKQINQSLQAAGIQQVNERGECLHVELHRGYCTRCNEICEVVEDNRRFGTSMLGDFLDLYHIEKATKEQLDKHAELVGVAPRAPAGFGQPIITGADNYTAAQREARLLPNLKIELPAIHQVVITGTISLDEPKKCECGAASCGTTHADYCPLYKRF